MLDLGLNPEGRGPGDKDTAVIAAARAGKWNTVKELVAKGADSNNPLLRFALRGFTDIVIGLIGSGANIEHTHSGGWTALIRAAPGGHTATVTALIQQGANTEHKTIYGYTAIMRAAWAGHTATVTALLTAGAGIHHRDRDNRTALSLARERNYAQIVSILEQKEADLKD